MITFLSVIIFLILATFALLFLRLFTALVLSFFRSLFGSSFVQIKPPEMLIATGITALIFTQTLNEFFRFFFKLLLEGYFLVSTSLSKVLQLYTENRNRYGDIDDIKLARELSSMLSYGMERIASLVNSFINNISFADLLAAIACILVIATVLNDRVSNPLLSINRWISGLTETTRKRMLLGIILIFGGYLSLAAIIAIPWIQGMNNKDGKEITELRNKLALMVKVDRKSETENFPDVNFELKQLKEIEQKLAAFKNEYLKPPIASRETQTATLTNDKKPADTVNTETKPATQNTTANTQEYEYARLEKELEKARQKVFFIQGDQKQLQTLWKDYQEKIIEKKEEMARQALGRFDTYADTDLTPREIKIYQDQLRLWFSNAMRILDRQVRSNKWRTEDMLSNWRRWITTSIEELEKGRKAPDKLYFYTNQDGSMFDLVELPNDSTINPPPTPKESIGLGIYGFFGNWLVESRSFALALISGMIGFGLFGAVMARALITYKPDIEAKIERESLDVLLVGFSAAVIIFLASQGGLALIANGEMQPNAYILFLSCFVGAAYGDKVWNTAKVRLKKSLDTKDDDQC